MNMKTPIKGDNNVGPKLINSSSEQVKRECVTKRRELLLQAGSVALSLSAFPSITLAENDVVEDFRVYSDDVNKFKIMIPSVSIVITSLSVDFTKLESFGKVDAFAENLVSGLDRSWQRPPGVKEKLIYSKASKGLYSIEYTLQNLGESLRHLFSVLEIADNGIYNRLYTLTGQFVDEEAKKYGAKIHKTESRSRIAGLILEVDSPNRIFSALAFLFTSYTF
ncbi:hypothetical protein H5410_060852 [Solanum commersonii]|uniref:PsbP C-terminal domain-containing protein n=1 Tax=Solanum commersonii TaxID=4109 RepID=A0A9J5W7T5_SOLCO|nr:hypothetical protein H5410_060852 [Solanum commersonii]